MTWKILHNILNRKNKINDLPKTFFGIDSSNEISDPKLIANEFNDYLIIRQCWHQLQRLSY